MKKILLFIMAMVAYVGAFALVEKPVPAFSALADDGETVQYLYNVETGAFLLGANDWNTRASLSLEKGYQFKVKANEGALYTLNNFVETKNGWYDMFVENPTSMWVDHNNQPNYNNWTITAKGDNTYTIGNAGVEGVLGTNNDIAADSRLYMVAEDAAATTWAFVNEADYVQYLEDAADYFAYLKVQAAKENLAKMVAELEATNVYTQEAYEAFMAKYPIMDWVAAGDELDIEAVNQCYNANFNVTGWHAANDIDDLLTSAWEGADGNFGGKYYINTWSTEGNNDGSNFRVPFFEYWTGDGNSLGENTMTATITGLMPGATYSLSSLTRVRIKNGAEAPAYGISYKVGDSEAVDACAGEQVGESQFYLGTVSAKGVADENGNLTVTYSVNADNNVSWLSWKNVKYTFVAYPKTVEEGTYYVQNNESGLFLQNGAYWGTRATLGYEGIPYNVVRGEDGKYTLKSNVKGDKALRPSDGFNDQSGAWILEKAENGVYMFNGEKYFYYDGSGIPQYTEEANDAAVWSFVTAEERLATVLAAAAKATAENPVEVSYLIKKGDFMLNDPRPAVWEGGEKIGGDGGSGCALVNSGNSEKWNAGTFDVHQTITGLPAGIYKLTAHAFYRETGANTASADAYENGTENSSILYAGEKEQPVVSVFSYNMQSGSNVTSTSGAAYVIPNSQGAAAACFEAGAYLNTIEGIEVGEDGTLTIGVKREGAAIADWTVFDQFRLYYCGVPVIEPTVVDAITTEYEDWGDAPLAGIETKVELYDGYVIVRGVAGVEGYDMKVAFDEDENVTGVTPIKNGVEGEEVTSGYCNVYTGNADYSVMQIYVGDSYDYAGYDEDGGYVLLSAYIGGVWSQYSVEWPYIKTDVEYNESATMAFITATPTQEGTVLYYSYDGEELQLVEGEIQVAPISYENGVAYVTIYLYELPADAESLSLDEAVATSTVTLKFVEPVEPDTYATYEAPVAIEVGEEVYRTVMRKKSEDDIMPIPYYYTFESDKAGSVTLAHSSSVQTIIVSTGDFYLTPDFDLLENAKEVRVISTSVEAENPEEGDVEDGILDDFMSRNRITHYSWNVEAGVKYYIFIDASLEGGFTVQWSDEQMEAPIGTFENPVNLNENGNTWTWVAAGEEGAHTPSNGYGFYQHYIWTAPESGKLQIVTDGFTLFTVGEGGWYSDWEYPNGTDACFDSVINYYDNEETGVKVGSVATGEVEAGVTYYILSELQPDGFDSAVITLLLNDQPVSIKGINTTDNKVIYNLAGARLMKAQKGVNIINGNKVLVK